MIATQRQVVELLTKLIQRSIPQRWTMVALLLISCPIFFAAPVGSIPFTLGGAVSILFSNAATLGFYGVWRDWDETFTV
jgi:hypothetical protein